MPGLEYNEDRKCRQVKYVDIRLFELKSSILTSKVCLLPPEYCTSRASPDLLHSGYLQDVGRELVPGIDILWTGKELLSFILWLCALFISG